MNRIIFGVISIGVVLTFIYMIKTNAYNEGCNACKIEEIKKQQDVEIKTQNDIINEANQVFKNRRVDSSKVTISLKNEKIDFSNTDSNLGWLYQKRCKDCQSR